MKQIARLATVLAVLLVAGSVLAQSGGGYDLTWYTVDGGGGTVSGDGYSLTGTIGQPEPGAALASGDYTLLSGFWGSSGEAPPACTTVGSVALSLVTSGSIYTDTVVQFSADIVPDDASKPYTYTIDYDDGHSGTYTASADPLTTPLNHTFTISGTYDVEIAAWNCSMAEGQAKTDIVQVTVKAYGQPPTCIYLPLVVRKH